MTPIRLLLLLSPLLSYGTFCLHHPLFKMISVTSKRTCGNVFVTERVQLTPSESTTRQAYVAEYSCPHKIVSLVLLSNTYNYYCFKDSTLTHCCSPPRHECCREAYFYEIDLSYV
jgi:hypothetical protein